MGTQKLPDLPNLAEPGTPAEMWVKRIDFERLPRHVAIQLNDTHPAIAGDHHGRQRPVGPGPQPTPGSGP